jgi:hypothetical protein
VLGYVLKTGDASNVSVDRDSAAGVSAIGAIAALALLPASRSHLPVDDLEASLQTASLTELQGQTK